MIDKRNYILSIIGMIAILLISWKIMLFDFFGLILLIPYANVDKAPGFSDVAFMKIKHGMTEAEVRRIVGEPIEMLSCDAEWRACATRSPNGRTALRSNIGCEGVKNLRKRAIKWNYVKAYVGEERLFERSVEIMGGKVIKVERKYEGD